MNYRHLEEIMQEMIRKGEFNIAVFDGMSFADEFYALAGQVRAQ